MRLHCNAEVEMWKQGATASGNRWEDLTVQLFSGLLFKLAKGGQIEQNQADSQRSSRLGKCQRESDDPGEHDRKIGQTRED